MAKITDLEKTEISDVLNAALNLMGFKFDPSKNTGYEQYLASIDLIPPDGSTYQINKADYALLYVCLIYSDGRWIYPETPTNRRYPELVKLMRSHGELVNDY